MSACNSSFTAPARPSPGSLLSRTPSGDSRKRRRCCLASPPCRSSFAQPPYSTLDAAEAAPSTASEADMCAAKRHVRFTPESRHVQCTGACPLSAKSGLMHAQTASIIFTLPRSTVERGCDRGRLEPLPLWCRCFRSVEVALKALKTAEKNEEVRQQPVEGFDPGCRHRQP